jgi:hypothetical protein
VEEQALKGRRAKEEEEGLFKVDPGGGGGDTADESRRER